MRETNILLTAVGRRAYLVDYFKDALKVCGGKVYAVNCIGGTPGAVAADGFEIVPKSADPRYVDVLVDLCRRWRIALLFSLHDWDAPVIARSRQRFLEVGTVPVMGDAAGVCPAASDLRSLALTRDISSSTPNGFVR